MTFHYAATLNGEDFYLQELFQWASGPGEGATDEEPWRSTICEGSTAETLHTATYAKSHHSQGTEEYIL